MVDRPGKARRGLSRPERLQGHGAGVGVREPSQADLGAPWMQLGRLWQQPVRGKSAWLGIPGVSGTSAWRGEAHEWVRHAQPGFPLSGA